MRTHDDWFFLELQPVFKYSIYHWDKQWECPSGHWGGACPGLDSSFAPSPVPGSSYFDYAQHIACVSPQDLNAAH